MKRILKRSIFVAVLMTLGAALFITACTNGGFEEPREVLQTTSQSKILKDLI